MANVYGYTRSSEIRVKNDYDFREWLKEWSHFNELYISDWAWGEGRFDIFAIDSSSGYHAWPQPHECDVENEFCEAKECGGPEDSVCGISRPFLEELARHLQDGTSVVLFQGYTHKAIFEGAHAVAVNSDGRCVAIDLDDAIKKLAAETFCGKEAA